MKKTTIIALTLLFSILFCGCFNQSSVNNDSSLSALEIARKNVIEKYKNDAGEIGTSRYIEDIYKIYPNDEVISNIYFYCIAKEQYDLYEQFSYNSDYLSTAKEYASKIDDDYNGEFSYEMHEFVLKLSKQFENSESKNEYNETTTKKQEQNNYNSLSDSKKKEICQYIKSRYEYYDSISGGYSGDKYSDTIMNEAANKYGLTVSEVKVIWMNGYKYN